MARRKAEEERSMDSLMDALTNVVGILLLILIISSLAITSAIKVVVENLPEVSVEQLEQIKTIVEEQRKQMAQLRETSALQEEITKDRDELQTQVALRIKDLEENNKELQEKVNDMAELERRLKEQKEMKVVNDDEVLIASNELSNLRAILEQTPEREVKEAEIVRMPNPRLSGAETQANYVVCKNQRVYFIGNPYDHTFIVRDLLDREAAKLAYRGDAIGSYVSAIQGTRLNDRKTGFEALTESVRKEDRFVKELPFANVSLSEWNAAYDTVSEGTVVNRLFGGEDRREMPVYEFRLDPAKVGALFGAGVPAPEPYDGLIYHVGRNGTTDRLVMEFGFNSERGWTREQFRKQGSAFDAALKNLSGKPNQLIYFHVASDSFRTYLAARDMADFYSLPAGWTTFRGDKIQLKATARIETARVNIALPVQDYVQIAAKVGPMMAQNTHDEITNFTTNLAAIKAPEDIEKNPAEKAKWRERLKAERQLFIRSSLQGWTRQVFQAAIVANEVRGTKEVGIDVHPPEIPHSRLFVPSSPPKVPKPVVDPNAPKPKPKPAPKPADTTKLILD
jgi:TolA-binding protein